MLLLYFESCLVLQLSVQNTSESYHVCSQINLVLKVSLIVGRATIYMEKKEQYKRPFCDGIHNRSWASTDMSTYKSPEV